MKIVKIAPFFIALIFQLNYSSIIFAESFPAAADQYIVEFNSSSLLSPSSITDDMGAFETLGATSTLSLITVRDGIIRAPDSSPALIMTSEDSAVCNDLLQRGIVKSCSPNFQAHASALPNETGVSDQYWHNSISSQQAWDVSTGGSSAIVAVLDTGIDYTHPDLVDNMWRNGGEIPSNGIDDDQNGVVDDIYGYNGVNDSGNPMDDNKHGTHVAGIIGARGNNGIGVVGVNWQTKIMSLKFLQAGGYGFISDAIKALDYMVLMKQRGVNIRVVNNSWGGGGYSQPLADTISRINDAGIIFVAAAGNSSMDNDVISSYPASYTSPNIVAVASTDQQNALSEFSNFGAQTVQIGAPGSAILSTQLGGGYLQLSGTSMATPFVSGALTLLLNSQPSLTVDQAITKLYQSATPSEELEGVTTYGRRLNVGNLLNNIYPPNPDAGEICNYSTEQIPYNPDTSVDATEVAMPRVGVSYPENTTVILPFQFPFYSVLVNHLNLGINGVAYIDAAKNPWDYRSTPFAPKNSIAPLYTYFYDYTIDRNIHGIRVKKTESRVDMSWNFSHPWNPSAGSIKVYLSIFPNGTIETHLSIPQDRLAKTLLYGSLVGIKGGNLSNSTTVSHNGFPVVLRNNIAFRFSRPNNCTTTTSQPSANPPLPDPQPTIPGPPSPTAIPTPSSPNITSIVIKGSKRNVVKTRSKYSLRLYGSGSGKVHVAIKIKGQRCSENATLDYSDNMKEYIIAMPAVNAYHKNMTVVVGERSANVKIAGATLTSSSLKSDCAKIIKSISKSKRDP